MLDLALELAPGICAYGECDPLARLHSTDVGFIDGDGDFHPAQVVCDRENRRATAGTQPRFARAPRCAVRSLHSRVSEYPYWRDLPRPGGERPPSARFCP